MESKKARSRSLDTAATAGIVIPASLPLLEDGLSLRDQEEVVSRLLCMNAVAAAAYGFNKSRALGWVEREKISALLTDEERRFLEKGQGRPQPFMTQIEGMWALAWALGLAPELNFWIDCDGAFANLLPDLKADQVNSDLRRKANYRLADDVVSALDLSYCLHWAIRQAQVADNSPAARLKPYVVIERRRALEWMLSTESWNDISLDT